MIDAPRRDQTHLASTRFVARPEDPMLTSPCPTRGPSPRASPHAPEAGYRCRPDGRGLTVVDPANGVRFYFLRPRDVAVTWARARSTGHHRPGPGLDSAPWSRAPGLGIGAPASSTPARIGRTLRRSLGRRLGRATIATSYPRLVADDLAARGIEAEIAASKVRGILRRAGRLRRGRRRRQHRTHAGRPRLGPRPRAVTSEAVVVGPDGEAGPDDDAHAGAARRQLLAAWRASPWPSST